MGSMAGNEHWLAARGACGDVIRSKDWSRHPLGPIERWPPALRTSVNTILACSFPLIILWGTELFQIYNDAYAEIMGPRHPNGMGQKTSDCWPEAWNFNRLVYERVFKGETVDYKNQLIPLLRDGVLQDYYFDLCYSPLQTDDQEIGGVLVTVFDVTERYNATNELRRSNRRLNALVAATCNSTFTMSPDWKEMRQLDGGGFLQNSEKSTTWLEDYIHPEDQLTVMQAVNAALASEKMYELEHRVRFADGTLGWTQSRAVPIRDEDGQIIEWFGAASDVTAKKLSERALLENEKLAVVGRLASSIAHEINNPLESVINLVYLAESTASDEQTKRYLQLTSAELERVSHITSATLRFHRQSSTPSTVNLNELIDSVLTLHQGRMTSHGISVERRYGTALQITCWPNEIRQVLANLVSNAIDAMRSCPERRLIVRSRTAGGAALISISDTGSGIAPTTLRRIFEPFFTTKDATGTGLGLWVSKNIIERHKGKIRVKSCRQSPRAGTIFSVLLPEHPTLPGDLAEPETQGSVLSVVKSG
ncbi:MAG TPA: ATP-binding protein [Edaphobacter sp.]|nr:ATP-binding protein [Edaphobacter sp.]